MILHRRDYDVVHTVDFDTAYVAVAISIILRKPIIYDAFDSISSIAGEGKLGKLLGRIERLLMARCDLVLCPSEYRLQQYGFVPTEKTIFIGNIPDSRNLPDALPWSDDGKLSIVYVGTLEAKHRALEFIPNICDRLPNLEFIVAGIGELTEFFKNASAACENLQFLGELPYEFALELLGMADCQMGCYLLSTPAHRYAAPNKMYEHLALGRPLLTNVGTPVATLVDENGSGFLFDGTIEQMESVLRGLTRAACIERGANAKNAWRQKFADLRRCQLERFFVQLERFTSAK